MYTNVINNNNNVFIFHSNKLLGCFPILYIYIHIFLISNSSILYFNSILKKIEYALYSFNNKTKQKLTLASLFFLYSMFYLLYNLRVLH